MKKIFLLPLFAGLLLSLSSCLVGKKKFDAQVAAADKFRTERDDCNTKLSSANATIDDLNNQIAKLNDELQKLKDSNASLDAKNKQLEDLKQQSDQVCEKVRQQLEQLTKSNTAEKDKLMKDLAAKEKELMDKENQLNNLSAELDKRDAKVRELQSLIARKDSAVQALKKKMLDALTSFNPGDLSVYEKDGKVYIALSDKLLFSTGSFAVDKRGKDALSKIAEVLNKNTDISIVVEGHTDNKQYKSTTESPVNSNWDLSVMRASMVTKILVDEDHVDPHHITPSGKSEYYPIESNDTPDGRSKNRRIEIELTPDMREIYNILNSAQ